jgi:hypothetical protein
MRSRSDQNREIESREDNVSVTNLTQSRKETEFREPSDGYFSRARWRRTQCRNAVDASPTTRANRFRVARRCVIAVA